MALIHIPTTVRRWLNHQTALENVDRFVAGHARSSGLVLDIGSQIRRYRQYFPGAVGIDLALLASIDVNADAERLPIRADCVDLVVTTEMLEHCHEPSAVISEIHRVLRPGGEVVLTTRFLFPVHDAPGDYHRFTAERMADLLRDFESVQVDPSETLGESVAVLIERLSYQVHWRVPGFRWLLRVLARLAPLLDRLVVQEYGDAGRTVPAAGVFTTGLLVTATKGGN